MHTAPLPVGLFLAALGLALAPPASGHESTGAPHGGTTDSSGLDEIGSLHQGPSCAAEVLPSPPPVVLDTGGTRPLITAGAVGDIRTGEPLPPTVLEEERKDAHELFFGPLEGVDPNQAMMDGAMDQWGYRIIQLSQRDLRVQMNDPTRVRSIDPGPSLKTPGGTGVGSTLGQLLFAHGGFFLNHVPEPYHCAVTVPNLAGVSFLFDDCEAACSGSPVRRVYVSGGAAAEEG